MKIIFDMSSVMWTSLKVGKDKNGMEVPDSSGKMVWVNTPEYGYDNAIQVIKSALEENNCTPIDAILVVEGLNSKARRLMIGREYKSKRGSHPIKAYEAFSKLREMLVRTLRSLGAIAISQDNVEGDDVIAWLATNIKEPAVIVSNDNDLLVLAGPNQFGAEITARINKEKNFNKYGDFPFKFVSLYKALVGDTSDSITGIKGFGQAAWDAFYVRFGDAGLEMLLGLAEKNSLNDLAGEAQQDKMIAKIYDGREDFLRSYQLAKLRPEWVDTMQDAVIWQPGVVLDTCNDARLTHWRAATRLIDANNWDSFVSWFEGQFKRRSYLALDIETSTPDESDQWLEAQGSGDGVDIIGSELTGMSLTFGVNMQYTVYISVDHADTANVPKGKILDLLKLVASTKSEIVIHNTNFEGPVLYNEFGAQWKDNGYEGLIPNWLDTKLEASYVDENFSLGLKKLSSRWLGYEQVDYKTVTTVNGVPHKMRELSAEHVRSYACDDTVATAALHNFFKLFMELEGTYEVYKSVEIDSSYLHAQSFVHGTKVSLTKLAELREEDDKTYDDAWKVLRNYLIANKWEGSVTPVYTELTASVIKESHEIVTGQPLKTMVRTPAKLIDMVTSPTLKLAYTEALGGSLSGVNALVASKFSGEPEFNTGSPKQMQKLFYETMQLPIVVFNKPTDNARARGEQQGSPKTDNLAIAYAVAELAEEDERYKSLQALKLMKMVQTRKSLYYDTYPYFVHWKTGRVHSSHNQCATNTRRASSSKPNIQQVSKSEKVEGFSPRVRELFIPHKRNAVIVSMDFMAQELRVIADYSRDPNMLSCFLGEETKDMHAMTGLGIFNSRNNSNWSYEDYNKALHSKANEKYLEVKKTRQLGKLTNFTTEFGAAAPKLAQTLMVSEVDAQLFIDAKSAAFPVVVKWKSDVISEVKEKGFVTTKMGARRHLRESLNSDDRYESSKAERQAVNFKIQSSSAEMTKRAEGRMFKQRLEQLFDCEIIGAIHDEIVVSCAKSDLKNLIPVMHECMVAPYGDMLVPVMSSISLGADFGQQIEIGDTPSEEVVDKGLSELKTTA